MEDTKCQNCGGVKEEAVVKKLFLKRSQTLDDLNSGRLELKYRIND